MPLVDRMWTLLTAWLNRSCMKSFACAGTGHRSTALSYINSSFCAAAQTCSRNSRPWRFWVQATVRQAATSSIRQARFAGHAFTAVHTGPPAVPRLKSELQGLSKDSAGGVPGSSAFDVKLLALTARLSQWAQQERVSGEVGDLQPGLGDNIPATACCQLGWALDLRNPRR